MSMEQPTLMNTTQNDDAMLLILQEHFFNNKKINIIVKYITLTLSLFYRNCVLRAIVNLPNRTRFCKKKFEKRSGI